ncbi:diadenosine tetraphosphate hydrolase [Hydrogenophaga sp. IBVHS2]|nr:diadenosine tetraphosphate hydrolase [Hydrogenophaga sp. IBVHS2]
MSSCPFCRLPEHRVLLRNRLAVALFDAYPVTSGHALVVPLRHVEDFWGLTAEERLACHELFDGLRGLITAKDPSVTGFNLGTNAGASAGQTVFHCHFHLIPRRDGDCENPRGGVRHVFQDKANYDPSAPSLSI